MAITDWPKSERPREKLLQRGAEALSDAELLAIFLRTGIKGKTAVDLARDLLKQFGGLRNLLQAEWQDFNQAKGLGIARYTQLKAILEMGRRHLEQIIARQDVVLNTKDTHRYLTAKLRQYPHEVFACMYLDVRMQVIHFEILTQGTLNSAVVYPREVVKRALNHHAAAIIFAHNHPSGKAQASESDKQLTKQLQQALALLDIRVLDHIIIGEGEILSFAEHGLLDPI
ncbi:MAG: DNA repair protein RadC [Gammaproteobacteria bacterium]